MAKSLLKNDKVKMTIDSVLVAFQKPEALDTIAKTMFKRGVNIPSDNWSFLNRFIMFLNNTNDARGYKAWQKVGRHCEKGEAFYIIAPRFFTKKEEVLNEKTGQMETKKKQILIGFYPIPVWGIEKTDGEEVDYKPSEEMPVFVGQSIAEKWGLSIKQTWANLSYWAYYSGKNQEIAMATPNQSTFFHELAHAAHERVTGKKFKEIDRNEKEVIAEFSSAVLMRMFGLKNGDANTYKYIKRFSKDKENIAESVIPFVSMIGKVVNEIMTTNESLNEKKK